MSIACRAASLALLVAPVLVVGACGGDRSGSAGSRGTPVWSLERVFEIGSLEDADASLTRVGEVVVSENGAVYVAQPRDGNIRVYDAAGELVRAIGRRGQGPGELESASEIGLRGDELWVLDASNQRVTWFTLDGELVRTSPWAPPYIQNGPVLHTLLPPADIVLRMDGTTLAYPNTMVAARPRGSGGGSSIPPEDMIPPILLTGPEGAILDTVARADPRSADPLGEGQRAILRSNRMYALHPVSSGVVVVRRATVGNPDPGTFRVAHLRMEGDTIFSRAYEYAAIATPSGLAAEYLEALPESRRAEVERTLWVPQTLPPVSDLIVGSDGVIWIAREAEAQDSVAWWALDPDSGDPMGMVHLPGGHELMESRRDRIVVHRTDEFDVPYLVGYRLTR